MGSSPGWTYGYVPTSAEWNDAFASKQDELNYAPVNRAGDSMSGRLVTFGATPSAAGFNVNPGVAPSNPVDGDIWIASAGLYVRINGSSVGPLNTGSVGSVGLAAPAQFTVTNSPVTGSGTLTLAWANQNANLLLAGPATGSAAAPGFRALVGADLPAPGPSSLGGVKSIAAVATKFLTSIGTDGTPANAQPAFTDISGQIQSAQVASGVAAANLGFTPAGLAANTFTGSQTWAKGANRSSASTLTLGTDGNYFHVTGTTTITAISGAVSPVLLTFDGALQLTHNGTSLILPGAGNIQTSAGDTAIFVSEGGGNWRCLDYARGATVPVRTQAWEQVSVGAASGSSVVITSLSAYRKIRVSGWLLPATDNVQLLLQTSINNGSTFSTGATDYSYQAVRAVTTTASGINATDIGILISGTTSVGSASSAGVSFSFELDEFNNANRFMYLNGTCHTVVNDGSTLTGAIGGRRLLSEARNAFRLIFSSGTITDGFVAVEGLRG